jgi:hypothetical protein
MSVLQDVRLELHATAGAGVVQRIAGVDDTGGGPHLGSGLTINIAAGLYETRA